MYASTFCQKLLEIKSPAEAHRCVDDDPFTRIGPRASVTIHRWIRAVFGCKFNTPTGDSPLTENSVAQTLGVA